MYIEIDLSHLDQCALIRALKSLRNVDLNMKRLSIKSASRRKDRVKQFLNTSSMSYRGMKESM